MSRYLCTFTAECQSHSFKKTNNTPPSAHALRWGHSEDLGLPFHYVTPGNGTWFLRLGGLHPLTYLTGPTAPSPALSLEQCTLCATSTKAKIRMVFMLLELSVAEQLDLVVSVLLM